MSGRRSRTRLSSITNGCAKLSLLPLSNLQTQNANLAVNCHAHQQHICFPSTGSHLILLPRDSSVDHARCNISRAQTSTTEDSTMSSAEIKVGDTVPEGTLSYIQYIPELEDHVSLFLLVAFLRPISDDQAPLCSLRPRVEGVSFHDDQAYSDGLLTSSFVNSDYFRHCERMEGQKSRPVLCSGRIYCQYP